MIDIFHSPHSLFYFGIFVDLYSDHILRCGGVETVGLVMSFSGHSIDMFSSTAGFVCHTSHLKLGTFCFNTEIKSWISAMSCKRRSRHHTMCQYRYFKTCYIFVSLFVLVFIMSCPLSRLGTLLYIATYAWILFSGTARYYLHRRNENEKKKQLEVWPVVELIHVFLRPLVLLHVS